MRNYKKSSQARSFPAGSLDAPNVMSPVESKCGASSIGSFLMGEGKPGSPLKENTRSTLIALSNEQSPATAFNPPGRARYLVSLSILAIWSTVGLLEIGSNRGPFPASVLASGSGDPEAEGVEDSGKPRRFLSPASGKVLVPGSKPNGGRGKPCSVNLLISEGRRKKCRAANFLS